MRLSKIVTEYGNGKARADIQKERVPLSKHICIDEDALVKSGSVRCSVMQLTNLDKNDTV